MGIRDEFRRRLDSAIERKGRKNVFGVDEAGYTPISEGGLSKILSGERENPGIFTVQAIAERAETTVGALLGETLRPLDDADRRFLRETATRLILLAEESYSRPQGRETSTVVTPPLPAGTGGLSPDAVPANDRERNDAPADQRSSATTSNHQSENGHSKGGR